MVQRRGAAIGGEAAELGRMAGEQEVALRTLVSGGLVPVSRRLAGRGPGSAGTRGGRPGRRRRRRRRGTRCDLRALLAPYAGAEVTFAEPGAPVPLAPRRRAGAGRRRRRRPGQRAQHAGDAGAGLDPGRGRAGRGDRDRTGRRPRHPRGPARPGRGRGPARRRPVDPGPAARPRRHRRADLGAGPGHGGRTEGTEGRERPRRRYGGRRRSGDGRRRRTSTGDGTATADGQRRRSRSWWSTTTPCGATPSPATWPRPASTWSPRRATASRRCAAPRPPRPTSSCWTSTCPPSRASQVCKELVGANPALRVLVLSASGEHADVLEAVKSGATGYLLKSASHGGTARRGAPHRRRRPGLHPGPGRPGPRRVPPPGLRAGPRRGRRRAQGARSSPTARPRCCGWSPRA